MALDPPTLIVMPMAFAVCIGVSMLDRSAQAAKDRAEFDGQQGRARQAAPSGMVAAAE